MRTKTDNKAFTVAVRRPGNGTQAAFGPAKVRVVDDRGNPILDALTAGKATSAWSVDNDISSTQAQKCISGRQLEVGIYSPEGASTGTFGILKLY